MPFRETGRSNLTGSSADRPARLPIDPARSPGKPLDRGTRSVMERRLGHDFGEVRVHAGGEAASAAKAMGARAVTRGDHIVLSGEPSPELLAHELAHVAQQREASSIEPRLSEPGEPSEEAADRVADAALAGESPPMLAGVPGSVPAFQRQADTGALPDFRLRPSSWAERAMGYLVIEGFPLGQSTLTGDQQDRIKIHAVTLKQLLDNDSGGRVSVTGHGDAVGTDERNLELGTERAKAVAAVLIEAGVPAELIDTDSAGKSQPAVPARGAEPRNRRAVIGFSPPLLRQPGPFLTPPTFDFTPSPKLDIGPTLPKPGITLQFPQTTLPPQQEEPKPGPRRDEPTDDWWKRSEEVLRRAREIEKKLPKDNRSPVERLGDAVAEALDPLIKRLPVSDDLKKKAREAVRDGVKAGSEKICEAGIDAVASGKEAEALKAACKGVLEYKPGQSGGQP